MLIYFTLQNQTKPEEQFMVSYADTPWITHFQVMQFQTYIIFIIKYKEVNKFSSCDNNSTVQRMWQNDDDGP